MNLIGKYKNTRAKLEEELKHTGNIHERQRLINEIKFYGAVIKDLEAEQRGGLKWGEVSE